MCKGNFPFEIQEISDQLLDLENIVYRKCLLSSARTLHELVSNKFKEPRKENYISESHSKNLHLGKKAEPIHT